MNKWIFFDIGSTLICEEAAYRRRISEMTSGSFVSFERYMSEWTRLAKAGCRGDAEVVRSLGLSKTPWHSEEEYPYDDSKAVLAYLKGKGYGIGVIANQYPGTEARLTAWDLKKYIDVVAASAELGISKPDKRIFQYALSKASCAPESAVMVGDRLDNDIAPAKELGFTTVRVLQGMSVYQTPKNRTELADYTIDRLSELTQIY